MRAARSVFSITLFYCRLSVTIKYFYYKIITNR